MSIITWVIASGLLDSNTIGVPQSVTADTASQKITDILAIVFAILGAITFLMVTIAGFMMVISAGEPQKVAKARQTIIYSTAGLVICILAFTIVKFVIGSIK